MRKIINKRSLLLFAFTAFMAISCLAGVLLGNYSYVTSAENATFWMEGAQVKYMKQDDSGLRFVLDMSAEQYNALKAEDSEVWSEDVQVGMLLVPEKLNNGLTLSNTENEYIEKVELAQAQWIADNEQAPTKYRTWVSIKGYNDAKFYTVDVTAVGYMQVGEATPNYTNSVTRSMTEVAYANKDVVVQLPDGTYTDSTWLSKYYEGYVHTVTFNANNGSADVTQALVTGKTVSEPTAPVVDGWTFDGWYNGTEKWDFSNKVTSDITLEAKYTQTVNVANAFEVYSGINGTTPTANTLEVALKNASAIDNANVTVNGEAVEYAWENDKLSVSGNEFGANVYGDVQMVVSDGAYTATVNVPVVTKYMAVQADLNNMLYYGGIDLTSMERAYDGYFVMTQSIDCNNTWVSRPSEQVYAGDIGNSNNAAYSYIGKCGFAGVFDGQGFAIKNVKAVQYHYGIFGSTQTGSLIKNLAVTGTLNMNAAYGRVLLGHNLAGEIQNCYFDVKVGDITATNTHLGGALGWVISGKITDVVVKFDTTNTPAGVSVGGLAFQLTPTPKYWENQTVFSNTHVFTQATNLYSYVGANAKGTVTKYDYDASATVTMSDATYWDLTAAQPVFKSVSAQA